MVTLFIILVRKYAPVISAAVRSTGKALLTELKQRFWNVETFIGSYRIPLYGYGLISTLQMPKQSLEALVVCIFLDKIISGSIDVLTNPARRRAKRDLTVAKVKAEILADTREPITGWSRRSGA